MKKFARIHFVALVLLAVKPHVLLAIGGYVADGFTIVEHVAVLVHH